MNSTPPNTAARSRPTRGALRATALLTAATLVAGAGALAAHLWLFPPRYQGWSEIAAGGAEVAGWVAGGSAPGAHAVVQIYVDDRFAAAGTADLPRPDVVRAGFARDERCGYRLPLPALAPGEHVARVYVLRATAGGARLTLLPTGEPLRFRTGETP